LGDTHTHTLRIQRGGTPRTRRYLCEFALDKEAFPSTNSRWMMGMSGGVLALCTLYQKALLLTTDTRSRFFCVCVCVCVCVCYAYACMCICPVYIVPEGPTTHYGHTLTVYIHTHTHASICMYICPCVQFTTYYSPRTHVDGIF